MRPYRGLAVLVVLIGAGITGALLYQQWYPHDAIAFARMFVESAIAGDIHTSYARSALGAGIGRTEAEFTDYLHRQLGHLGSATPVSITLNSVRPYQTHGNRLRRRLSFREVDDGVYDVDMMLMGANGRGPCVPFSVKVRRQPDETFRVVYFQSHAM